MTIVFRVLFWGSDGCVSVIYDVHAVALIVGLDLMGISAIFILRTVYLVAELDAGPNFVTRPDPRTIHDG